MHNLQSGREDRKRVSSRRKEGVVNMREGLHPSIDFESRKTCRVLIQLGDATQEVADSNGVEQWSTKTQFVEL